MLLVGAGVGKYVHSPLLIGHVQQTPQSVDGDRRRAAAKSGAARQHRTATAASSLRVHPVDLLVVQVGDEHVTGNAIDRDGAREERALIAASRRRTPAPLRCSLDCGQTRHLPEINHIPLVASFYGNL